MFEPHKLFRFSNILHCCCILFILFLFFLLGFTNQNTQFIQQIKRQCYYRHGKRISGGVTKADSISKITKAYERTFFNICLLINPAFDNKYAKTGISNIIPKLKVSIYKLPIYDCKAIWLGTKSDTL